MGAVGKFLVRKVLCKQEGDLPPQQVRRRDPFESIRRLRSGSMSEVLKTAAGKGLCERSRRVLYIVVPLCRKEFNCVSSKLLWAAWREVLSLSRSLLRVRRSSTYFVALQPLSESPPIRTFRCNLLSFQAIRPRTFGS